MSILTPTEAASRAVAWNKGAPTNLWLANVTYQQGEIVVHGGSVWIQVNSEGCVNSEPTSSNANWVDLLGGGQTFLTRTSLTANQLNHLFTAPVIVFPAPGAGKVLLAGYQIGVFRPGTIGYGFTDSPTIYYRDSVNRQNGLELLVGSISQAALILLAPSPLVTFTAGQYETDGQGASRLDNAPLILRTVADQPGGGIDPAAVSLGAGGAGYAPGDISLITTGDANALVQVDTVDGGGAVLTFHIIQSGSGYSVGNGQPTLVQSGGGDGNLTINVDAVGAGNGTLDVFSYCQVLTL